MLKLSEAIEKMNPGDRFLPKSSPGTEWEMWHDEKDDADYFKTGNIKRISLSRNHFTVEGKLIRAEPEVLTAKEILSKIDVKCSFFSDTSWVHVVDAIDISDKNGRNKEWKRIQDQLKNGILLQEITPPWEPEK